MIPTVTKLKSFAPPTDARNRVANQPAHPRDTRPGRGARSRGPAATWTRTVPAAIRTSGRVLRRRPAIGAPKGHSLRLRGEALSAGAPLISSGVRAPTCSNSAPRRALVPASRRSAASREVVTTEFAALRAPRVGRLLDRPGRAVHRSATVTRAVPVIQRAADGDACARRRARDAV
jgi:hypothetical protein